MPFDPEAESWELPIVGFVVTQVWFSRELYVLAYQSREESGWTFADFPKAEPHTKIMLESSFVYASPDGSEHHLSATEPWESLVPMLALRGARIESAQADRLGVLRLRFEDGSTLGADELWELAGPGALILASADGGGDPRIAGTT